MITKQSNEKSKDRTEASRSDGLMIIAHVFKQLQQTPERDHG